MVELRVKPEYVEKLKKTGKQKSIPIKDIDSYFDRPQKKHHKGLELCT